MSNNRISPEKDFIERLRSLRQQTNREYRAPHKPLLLLVAFAGVYKGEKRLMKYSDNESGLSKLLVEFGPPVINVKPFEPFKRLHKDNLWELVNVPCHSASAIEKLTGGHLKKLNAMGGLLDKDFQLLRQNPDFLFVCIREVLDNNFPWSYHSEILQAVGLPTVWTKTVGSPRNSEGQIESYSRTRDPHFRKSILKIYERACSICRSTVRLNDTLMGLEAAHIKWHAHGGPDDESNGLALCSFHHKAFDRGVIGLKNVGDDYTIEVSEELNGHGPAMDWLRNFENKKIFKVKNYKFQPSADYVDWHREQVFRK